MRLDVNHQRARITAALRSNDDTLGEKAATYLDVASGALNRIEELESAVLYQEKRFLMYEWNSRHTIMDLDHFEKEARENLQERGIL